MPGIELLSADIFNQGKVIFKSYQTNILDKQKVKTAGNNV